MRNNVGSSGLALSAVPSIAQDPATGAAPQLL